MAAEWRLLDDIDLRIIELLRKDGRMSFIDIGRKVGLSEGAVRRRIKLLQEKGIIKRFTIEVDRGYGVSAITFIHLEYSSSAKDVVNKVAKVPGVETVYELTGRFDALAIISAPSIGELNERIDMIRNIEGVKGTETAVILRIID
ncbi:MAG: Lrp/AsnC family transcriptional regulator [Candidatus Wolframiiraptor sp.]|nr:MAG: Lrp/AsnC family transcriptional regulator [Candidatus Wolframiiraptor sp.]